jgi:hypothetical protein
LRADFTERLLKGCRVHMQIADHFGESLFTLKSNDGTHYCQIRGMRYGGKFYTLYSFNITPTKYRKRMHKFLPITLPEGARCDKDTPCIYHHADGSVAHQGHWHGGRVRRTGYPSEGRVLVISDEDGRLLNGETNAPPGIFPASIDDDSTTPIDVLHGFLPGSCQSKLEWYASMECPEGEHYETEYKVEADLYGRQTPKMQRVDNVPGPLWDTKKMKLLAAKAHSSALAFVRKFPNMKIAMYPMAPERKVAGNMYQHGPLHLDRFEQTHRETVVLGRDIDDNPITYFLPTLVVYWAEGVGHKYPFSYHDSQKHILALRHVKIVVPPVGCESLLRGKQGLSPLSPSYRPGPKQEQWGFDRNIGHNHKVQERACHGLVCFANRNLDDCIRHHELNHWAVPSERDEKFHNWDLDQGKVVVSESIEAEGQWQIHHEVESYACHPGQVFSHMEEKELLDSLPMC